MGTVISGVGRKSTVSVLCFSIWFLGNLLLLTFPFVVSVPLNYQGIGYLRACSDKASLETKIPFGIGEKISSFTP